MCLDCRRAAYWRHCHPYTLPLTLERLRNHCHPRNHWPLSSCWCRRRRSCRCYGTGQQPPGSHPPAHSNGKEHTMCEQHHTRHISSRQGATRLRTLQAATTRHTPHTICEQRSVMLHDRLCHDLPSFPTGMFAGGPGTVNQQASKHVPHRTHSIQHGVSGARYDHIP